MKVQVTIFHFGAQHISCSFLEKFAYVKVWLAHNFSKVAKGQASFCFKDRASVERRHKRILLRINNLLLQLSTGLTFVHHRDNL